MDETVFFAQGNVSVSNARFIVGNQTYAMSGVTSVKRAEITPSRTGPFILGGAGIIALINAKLMLGLIGVAIAVAWWVMQKTEIVVALHTASGEVQALRSKDGKFIDSVISALNQSIIHRG